MSKEEARRKELIFQLKGIKERYIQAFKDENYELADILQQQANEVLEEAEKIN